MARFMLRRTGMGSGATVLIVDDEPGVRESLRFILGGECTVHTAASGTDALRAVTSLPVDVVTLDLRMPGLDGLGVLERIKAHDPDIEVLIITGYHSCLPRTNGTPLRAFDYVSKPFDIDHVRRLVRRAVAHRRAIRRLREAREELVASLGEAFSGPLNALLGGAEGPGNGTIATLTDEQRCTLDGIRSNSAALLRYVEGILRLARLASDAPCLVPEQVCVTDLLRRIYETHQGGAAAKGLHLRVHGPRNLVVETDRALLTTVLEELTENAIKFTERGEVVLGVRPGAEGAGATISVCDTGMGIDPAASAAVNTGAAIGPTTHATRRPGVALGLLTVTAISRHLGARVEITAERARGTECRLSLPARMPDSLRSSSTHSPGPD